MLENIKINVSDDHRFGTDAVLLADFAAPKKKDTVCDLCSGCGIVSLLFCRKNPPVKIYALELQREASELLALSMEENGLSDIITPVNEDLRNIASIPRQCADIVAVNPPYYLPKAGLERLSKAQAIARHELMCTLDEVVAAADYMLKYGGSLKMCHIPQRLTDVFSAMRKYNIEPKTLRLIQSKENEQPWLFLVSGKKGAKSGLTVEKNFVMYNDDGTPTEALKKAYEG